MLRTILWAFVFFFLATSIAIQPACQGWSEKPINKITIRMRQ